MGLAELGGVDLRLREVLNKCVLVCTLEVVSRVVCGHGRAELLNVLALQLHEDGLPELVPLIGGPGLCFGARHLDLCRPLENGGPRLDDIGARLVLGVIARIVRQGVVERRQVVQQ